MEFIKYNSIENTYRDEFITSMRDQGLHAAQFVVQEKVHGSNLCFITDGITVWAARRYGVLNDDEVFYNFQTIKRKYEKALFDLWGYLSLEKPGLKCVAVFGELFGGIYPHEEVPKNKEVQAVQKGLYYSPDNGFYAFDILVDNHYYLDVDTANQLFEMFGFFYAKTLFQGDFDDCLRHPNTFPSKVPQWLGLPEIPGNICEGIVIRPVEPSFLRNGSRVLLKSKNDKWAENSQHIDKRLLQFGPEFEEMSDNAVMLHNQVLLFITQNRLINLISKLGPVTEKDYGRILGLFCKDILDDFANAYSQAYKLLEKTERKALNRYVNSDAGRLVSGYLKSL